MLLWIALGLVVLWALGTVVLHLGAAIHLALVVAVVAVLWHWLRARDRVGGPGRPQNGPKGEA
jgi:MFS superfamily sulfate permease-like transporter